MTSLRDLKYFPSMLFLIITLWSSKILHAHLQTFITLRLMRYYLELRHNRSVRILSMPCWLCLWAIVAKWSARLCFNPRMRRWIESVSTCHLQQYFCFKTTLAMGTVIQTDFSAPWTYFPQHRSRKCSQMPVPLNNCFLWWLESAHLSCSNF